MIWSLSGNISIVHHLLFGIHFTIEGLAFEPFVPRKMSGIRSLNRFRDRGAWLNIELTGWGNEMASFTLDGVEQQALIPANMKGTHQITLTNQAMLDFLRVSKGRK
jgi:hypothetical protein